MTVDTILAHLAELGARPDVERGRLIIRLAGQVPPLALREAAWAHEAEIVARLHPTKPDFAPIFPGWEEVSVD